MAIGGWHVDVPGDWTDKGDAAAGYLESADGSVGCYVKVIRPAASQDTPRTLAEGIQAIHEASFRQAVDRHWRVVAHQGTGDAVSYQSRLDMLDEANQYRILSLVTATAGEALQVTIHNYACTDYAANRDAYGAIASSLRRAG